MNSKNIVLSVLFTVLLTGMATAAVVTFQEGVDSFSGTEDSYMDGVASRQNNNNGASEYVSVRVNGGTASTLDRELYNTAIRFGNISVPTDDTIVSATLTLTVRGMANTNGTHNAKLYAYALSRDWTESEVTWSNATSSVFWQQAGAKGANDRGTLQDTVSLDFGTLGVGSNVVIDISPELVKSWIDNPSSNNGVVLTMSDNNYRYPQVNFESSESTAGVAKRPLLTIETITGTVLREGLHSYDGTRDAYIDGVAARQNNNYGTSGKLGVRINGGTASDLDRELLSSVIRFSDIDSYISQYQCVTNATLTLTVQSLVIDSGTHDAKLHAYALSRDWNESEVTWSNATSSVFWQQAGAKGANDRGTLQDTVSLDFSTLATGSNIVINLSPSLVKSWSDNPAGNEGVLLTMSDNNYRYPQVYFDSSESTNTVNRPYLIIQSRLYKGTVIIVK